VPILPRRLAISVSKLLISLALLIFQAIAFAQSITLSIGSGSGTAGGTVTLPINLTSTGGVQTAGLQWSFKYSSDITGVAVAAGPSTTNGAKSLTCFGITCLIIGVNSPTIADGTVALATFQIAANPSSNPISVQLTSVVAATAGGAPITSSGGTGTTSLPGATTALSSLNCISSTINTPGSNTCSVTLTGIASGSGFPVSLASNNANLTVPSSVTVATGQISNTFIATGAVVSTVQAGVITASAGGLILTSTLSLMGPAQLSSLACAPLNPGSNSSRACTVALNRAVTSAATVSLASNNAFVTVPANITVAPGQSTATFNATSGTASSGQTAILTASFSGQSQQTIITLAAAAQISTLTCVPAIVNAPGTALCTITLTAATPGAASVTVISNNANITAPGSVNISSGLSTAAFTAAVAPVTSNQNALLTATLNGVSQSFALSAAISAPATLTSVACGPSTPANNASRTCTVTLDAAATNAATVSLASNNGLLIVPANVTVASGQNTSTFMAKWGTANGSQNATITANLDGQTQKTTIALAPPVDCQEFQTSAEGLCMIQDVLPWIAFGGGWESRLNAGNSGSGSGTIQFSFTLLPAAPATGGVRNRMPAFFTDSITGQTQVGETGTYALSAGGSVAVDFLSPPLGCDINGRNCGISPDPNGVSYGSLQVQYVADNPASLRGIAKAQLTLFANVTNPDNGWQATESETPPSTQWTAPVSVSANPAANPQAGQQASAALANPGTSAITVRGTLYDKNGVSLTFRDFQVPAQGTIAFLFSQDPRQPSGGFGQAMFPLGQDFNGLVTFQVTSPGNGSLSAMVLQYVGNAVSNVAMNLQSAAVTTSSTTRCAEFAMAADGSCSVQYMLPWVVFGGGWESRLKAGNPPSPSSGAVQLRFTLLPAAAATNGVANHLPAYFIDNRIGQPQVGEGATYTLGAGQSVDVHLLEPPAGCDSNGQNCLSRPDPGALSYGSVLVQYSSFDPATLRRQVNPQLALLAHTSGPAYASQITENAVIAANRWTAPVGMSAKSSGNPRTDQQASAAINNPGSTPVTVRGTLRDQDGNIVTYNDFQVPALGTTGIVFSWEPGHPFGGFGSAAFPQGQNFNGSVTFEDTSQASSGVSVVVFQYGDTISSGDAR